MRSFPPYGTLILLLFAALAIFVGGGRLAGRTERVHLPGNRAPIHAFAAILERELSRLERVYVGHLRRIATNTAPFEENRQQIWQTCQGIAGIVQWSMVHSSTKAGKDLHLPIAIPHPAHLPEPALRLNTGGLPRDQIILAHDELFQPEGEVFGWMDQPGKPLLFWQRYGNEAAVVLLLDPAAIQATIAPTIAACDAGHLPTGSFNRGAVAVVAPDGHRLAGTGKPPAADPDFVRPIRSRLGTWQVAAWDPVETRTFRDPATQAATRVLALFVALLGLFGFVQQRRMLMATAQRVSFVNRVSHELRTPLTNILLNLDLAADELASQNGSGESARRLAMVGEEARRLGRLIDNVLAFSRIERGQVRTEQGVCIPQTVIQGVIDQFAPSFARRKVRVRAASEVSAPCRMDSDALSQILSNLLSNVEKYAPGSTVEIAAVRANDRLIVTVSDDGPGIPPRASKRIFEPFERLDNRVTEGVSGAGLGLAISRDLASNAGGSLRLLPSAQGARFELCLPAPSAADPHPASL